jgi:hypothetical protein
MALYTRTYGDYPADCPAGTVWMGGSLCLPKCPPGQMYDGSGNCTTAATAMAMPSGGGGGGGFLVQGGALQSGRYQTTDCPSGWSWISGGSGAPAVCLDAKDVASTPLPGQAALVEAQASIAQAQAASAQAGASTSKTALFIGAGLLIAYFLFMKKGA